MLQGPILSANTKLVVEKLAEEEAERKVKGEAKKEKQLVFPFKIKYYVCVWDLCGCSLFIVERSSNFPVQKKKIMFIV